MKRRHRHWAWAVPVLVLIGCKPDATEEPEGRRSSSSAGHRSILPIEICQHLARMVAAEAGVRDPPLDTQIMAECEQELRLEAGIRGTDNWNALASCVLDSRNEADLDLCDQLHPMPIAPSTLASDSPRERGVCEHMIQVIMLESAAERGEVPQITPDELRALNDECVRSFVQDQQPALPPDDYTQMLDCIDAAQTGEQMRLCE